jgi:hypothetical protein
MKELHDRINRVIHTRAFEHSLEEAGVDLFEFQCNWCKLSNGSFDGLPEAYKKAILAGEAELVGCVELELA